MHSTHWYLVYARFIWNLCYEYVNENVRMYNLYNVECTYIMIACVYPYPWRSRAHESINRSRCLIYGMQHVSASIEEIVGERVGGGRINRRKCTFVSHMRNANERLRDRLHERARSSRLIEVKRYWINGESWWIQSIREQLLLLFAMNVTRNAMRFIGKRRP